MRSWRAVNVEEVEALSRREHADVALVGLRLDARSRCRRTSLDPAYRVTSVEVACA
jgi:hypothetical protein